MAGRARGKTSRLSSMQPEEVGYVPRIGFLHLWTFCVWVGFGLLLSVHVLFMIPDEESSEPNEEGGEEEAGE